MTFLRPVNRSRRFRISVAGLFLFLFCFCSACGKQTSLEETAESPIQSVEESAAAAVEWSELTADGAVPVEDATLFQIATYPEGYRLITLGKEEQQEQYLIVPEHSAIPSDVPTQITVLRQPLAQIYLVSTSVMDMICALDGLSSVHFTGTDISGWYIDEAKTALENGSLLYAGKYQCTGL